MSGYEYQKLHRIGIVLQIFALLCVFLQGCDSRAPLKVLNSTEAEVQITSIHVNDSVKSTERVTLPPRTAQQYSLDGHINNVSLSSGDTLVISFIQAGRQVQSSCVVARRPEGVCLVIARYDGSSSLICGKDCETEMSN